MKLSNSAINRVGDIIRQGETALGYDEAVSELNAWREAHGPLMDEFFDKCVKMTGTEETKNIIVAQRLKRLPTIIDKLSRFETMRLSSMQDIAGVRMIVRDMKQFAEIEKRLKGWKNFNRVKDYIKTPKDDGYRGKHFIFKKDGMFVEIQLRTQIQHIWATSVETVDTFRGTSMKTKKEESYWYNFFRQTSSALAIAEGTNLVAEYDKKSLKEICSIIKLNMVENKIRQSLQAIEIARQAYSMGGITKNDYFLVLDLDFRKKVCNISSFEEAEYDLAVEKYQGLEKSMEDGKNIVLVSVSDLRKLDEAYPNYFLNLRFFNELVDFLLEKYDKKG